VVNLGAIPRCIVLCGHLYLPQQKEEQVETNFKSSCRVSGDPVHI
jgi:hypothetical protein